MSKFNFSNILAKKQEKVNPACVQGRGVVDLFLKKFYIKINLNKYIMELSKIDPQVAYLIKKENERQQSTLNFIASENYPSLAVREALSSIFIAKYSEGRPRARYYGGMENIDKLEKLAEERARKIFVGNRKGWNVNVQPLSGSPANYAVLRGLLKIGDKIMGLDIKHGGHLTHGAKTSLSGKDFKSVPYQLDEKTGLLNYQKIKVLAKKEKPNLIICGFSGYPRKVDFKKFREIADAAGAYLMADVAHIAGLIAGGVHPNPIPYVDVMTTTTHKSLRGPRGAIIICREELADKIFKMVFPGLQGGPHNHTIAAIAVALKEASSPKFKKYTRQIIKNARVLAKELIKSKFKLISGGTDNHLVLIDLTNKGMTGGEAQEILEKAGIIVNKNMIPYDSCPPQNPSGIRLGTPAVTTRGFKEKEIKIAAGFINDIITLKKSPLKIKNKVRKLCKKFSIL